MSVSAERVIAYLIHLLMWLWVIVLILCCLLLGIDPIDCVINTIVGPSPDQPPESPPSVRAK